MTHHQRILTIPIQRQVKASVMQLTFLFHHGDVLVFISINKQNKLQSRTQLLMKELLQSNPDAKVWRLQYSKVTFMVLHSHIMQDKMLLPTEIAFGNHNGWITLICLGCIIIQYFQEVIRFWWKRSWLSDISSGSVNQSDGTLYINNRFKARALSTTICLTIHHTIYCRKN